jgi:DNA-binding CsgD family transcriptional regulator
VLAQQTLLERDAELDELDRAVQRATEGEGSTILVEGPAGTGKSTLVAAAGDRARDAGLRVLRARGSELEREFGFGVMRQLFEGVLADRSAAERRRLFSGVARPAERVLAATAPAGAPASDGFATLHAVHWLTLNLADESPLLLAIDDAHWADVSSLRALGYLAGRLYDSPVVLLIAFRPHEPDAPEEALDALRSEPGATRLTLRPLSAAAVASLVRARLPSADPDLCAAVAEATGGNPFLLGELLAAADAGGADLGPDPAATVRQTAIAPLGERLMRRIGRVGPEAPALASAMAALGPEGPLSRAAAIAGLSEQIAAPIAHQLRRIEILTGEDPFVFAHPLVRRSIYDATPAAERNALHLSAARMLTDAGEPVESAAAQLAPLPPSGSAEVAEACFAAAQEARSRAAPEETIRWLERALEEDAPQPPRATILEELGMTRSALRDTAAIPNLQEALELAAEPATRLRVAAALTEVLAAAGQWTMAIEVLGSTGDDLREASTEEEAELAAVRAVAMVYDPAYADDVERDFEHLEELAMQRGWASHALAGVLSAHVGHRRGDVRGARRLAEQALGGGRLIGERGAGTWAPIHPIGTLVEIDENDRALAASEELGKAAREQGSVFGQIVRTGLVGWIDIRRGELAAGEAAIRSSLAMANTAQMPMAATTGIFFLGDALLERPGHEDLAAFVESVELESAFAGTWSGAHLLMMRGQLRLLAGDRDRAVEDLRGAHRIEAGLGWGPIASPIRSTLALALPAGAREEARRLANEDLELARGTGLARGQGIALRSSGMLDGGDEGVELLRESVSLLESVPARLELARSLTELGAALRRGGHVAEAREKLAAGLELAHGCGAERLLAGAREELSVAGGRPRRIATSGVAALTPSERRVVDLAASGATNAEIAQELFVGAKTVETHLSHAYAKLGITGAGARARLPEVLVEGA